MILNSSSVHPFQRTGVVPAKDWFASGRRVPYNLKQKRIVNTNSESADTVYVFERVVRDTVPTSSTRWLTMLPGFPDGSYGYSKIDLLLSRSNAPVTPRLYVEYVGQGDSDKPNRSSYNYGTMERADLVQAQWNAHDIQRTVVVTFDYSSLVLMELLQRQREGKLNTKIEHVLIINGGLFADGHSHPLTTTPLLQTPIGRMGTLTAQRSNMVFNSMLKPLFGKEYRSNDLTTTELNEIKNAIRLRNGTKFLSNAAGFVKEHKSKQYALRWDLQTIYNKYAKSAGITFTIIGSVEDPFERKQISLTRQRLKNSVNVIEIPGGHMATSEQSYELVSYIESLVVARNLVETQRIQPAWTSL